MSFLVAALMDFTFKGKELSKEEYKIYQYGLQACMEMVFCLLVCLVIAVKMEMLKESVMFFGIFVSTRSYVGGIHMKSYWLCFIMSCGVFTVVLYLAKYFTIGNLEALLLILFSICVIYYIGHCGKFDEGISNEERIFYNNKMNIIFGVWIMVFIVLLLFRFNSLLTLGAYTFASIMLSKIAELVKNKVRR